MAEMSPDFFVRRWSDPASRPLFKGQLIDDTGCKCAQGDILSVAGWSDDRLRDADQKEADREVAALLGITQFEAVLLRIVNDRKDGAPQSVLTSPEDHIGPKARQVIAFMCHVEAFTPKRGDAAGAATWDAAWAAAWDAAWAAAWDAAGAATWDAAWDAAARDAAGAAAGAVWEIMGADVLRAQGRDFFFLPIFGWADENGPAQETGR